MVDEVMRYLSPEPGDVIADGTMGGFGHGRRILSRILPGGLYIGVDKDAAAVENARQATTEFSDNLRILRGNFAHLPGFLTDLNIDRVNGVLLDLGLSLHHIEDSGRGFSFMRDEPLDMRMDDRHGETAFDIVNGYARDDLSRLIGRYGEERHARRIAAAVDRRRKKAHIRTSGELADIVAGAVPKKGKQRIHPATRTFQALRIAVNGELSDLKAFMEAAPDLLAPGGRLVVLSFHSLEDRIVKRAMAGEAKGCDCPPGFPVCVCGKTPRFSLLTRKAVTPTEAEIRENPPSRSTKLRAALRL